MAFRVGVTGAREIGNGVHEALAGHVAAALAIITQEVSKGFERSRSVFAPGSSPLLRVLSPLADGADRIVAREGIAAGFQLEVLLPFARADYEKTFGTTASSRDDSIAEFDTLLPHADDRIFVLDGHREEAIVRHRSYEAVGRLVVRNSDLVIAIWDGGDSRLGGGGTVDMVHYALRSGVPVWCIDAKAAAAPRLLTDIFDLGQIDDGAFAEDAIETLAAYIAATVTAPSPETRIDEGWWDRCVGWLRARFMVDDPLLIFLNESGLPNRHYWRTHKRFIDTLCSMGLRRSHGAGAHRSVPPAPLPSQRASVHKLARTFLRGLALPVRPFWRGEITQASSAAARLSGIYRDRYRTSYLIVFLCAALALTGAVFGIAATRAEPAVAAGSKAETLHAATTGGWIEPVLTTFELSMLLAILALVVANEVYRWHSRYISYRMLGELLRHSETLRQVGWNLAGSRVNTLASGGRENWVAWFFAAIVRATPMAVASFDIQAIERIRSDALDRWIAGQIAFHRQRAEGYAGASRILSGLGRLLFIATLVLVVVRTTLLFLDVPEALGLMLSLACAVLPALSAACFGVRSYEELEVLADRSEQMSAALERAQYRLGRIDAARPLASQMIAAELFDATTIMLSEVADWAQLFRMKAVEA